MTRLLLICDADGDYRQVSALVDRVLSEEGPEWVRDQELLDPFRRWTGLNEGTTHTTPSGVKALAEQQGLRFYGWGGGAEAKTARKALTLAERMCDAAEVLAFVMVRDSENDETRLQAMKKARDGFEWPWPVVLGVQHPMRESWLLACFTPENSAEESAWKELCAALGLDPCAQSHRLRAKSEGEERHPRRILRALIGSDTEREGRCWASIPLAALPVRGQENGLAGFLAEVREHLLPRLGG